MPNHCQNYLVLSHPDTAEIERAKKALEDGRFFTEFFPCPEELNNNKLSTFGGPDADEIDQMRRDMVEKYGYPSWYEWNIANWGTKWDAYDISIDEDLGRELIVEFDTAWAPPIGFYDAMYELGFGVDAMYNEFGCAFCGHYINGSDDYYEYNQSGNGIPAEVDECFEIRDTLAEFADDDDAEPDSDTSDDQQVIDKVLAQIQADIDSGDLTSIEELLKAVPLENLKEYLPEGV